MTETDLVDRVDRDPELSGDEEETAISMYGQDKQFTIYSAKPTVVKSKPRANNHQSSVVTSETIGSSVFE